MGVATTLCARQSMDSHVAVVDTTVRVVAPVARRVGGNSAFLADIDTNAASWCFVAVIDTNELVAIDTAY